MIVITHWEILVFVLFIWWILIKGVRNKGSDPLAGLCIMLMTLGALPTFLLTINVLIDLFDYLSKHVTFESF
jgi:hypothetical protein